MPAFAETDDAEDDGRHATDDDDESEVTAGRRPVGYRAFAPSLLLAVVWTHVFLIQRRRRPGLAAGRE